MVTPLAQEFMDLHDLLRHMPFAIMFKLCKEGKLDKKFLALQSVKLLCPSCIFGTCKKTPCRIGAHPIGNICTPCKNFLVKISFGSDVVSLAWFGS